MKTTEISNSDDYINTCDITECIEELESELELDGDLLEQSDKEELIDELEKLKAFADEIGEYAFDNQEVLIRDSYFETYAREFAEAIGAISSDTHWPATCIDWEQAARELQMDYTCVDFDGIEYWVHF